MCRVTSDMLTPEQAGDLAQVEVQRIFEWLAQGRVHAGLILLPSTRTRIRNAIAAVAGAIENVLRDHPDGLNGSERWIGPLP